MTYYTTNELLIIRHLRLNDANFIHQFLDISLDFACDCCSRYQTALNITKQRGENTESLKDFDKLEKIILLELDNEAQKHD